MKPHVVKHFQVVDPVLAAALEGVVDFELSSNDDYFFELCDAIISQQLSTKVARVIRDRFIHLFPTGKITPEQVLQKSHEELRAIGLSNAKAKYVRSLAKEVTSGRVNLENLPNLSNEEVIAELVKVKGIGPWTAEMFLMFTLGREDVFSCGDLGLRRAVQQLYGLDEEPTPAYLLEISQKWSPYRTYASRILWKSLDNK